MATPTWKIVATGVLAVGWAGTEPPAFGESAPCPNAMTVKVLVDDSLGVPDGVLTEARKQAGRIFENIDVEIAWLEPRAVRRDEPAALASVIVVHLVGREMTNRMHAADHILGMSAGRALATVFYNRVEELSPTRDRKDIGCVLGHVIAHEIGHLLLRSKEHSLSGIMQEKLNVQRAARGALFFTPIQARLIRATLER